MYIYFSTIYYYLYTRKIVLEPAKCRFIRMKGPVIDEGTDVGFYNYTTSVSLSDCIALCNDNEKCNSFTYRRVQHRIGKKYVKSSNCDLKDKTLGGSEPLIEKNSYWYSVYKVCGNGNNIT